MGEKDSKKVFYILVTLAAGGVFAAVVGLTMLGVVAPWSGRFYSLWDTGPFTYSFSTGLFQNRTGRFCELSKGYARIHIPIISSVSEHQPTMWTSFITDLHFLPAVAPAGLWYTIKVCSKYMSSGNIYGF